jgi:hypothetical protein
MNGEQGEEDQGPPRPLDVWRICGRPTEAGCTCDDRWGPSPLVVVAALKRLGGEL